jgi:serine/threonine-protein kinase
MGLQPGTRVGPYEIAAQIGVGGMGEVYRATDTNLGRAVAIKVLPDAFAQDPDRLARFDREARTLAVLNHPHIAQIHGLERSGGTVALVMELVDGPTLADRIALGAVPVDEALPIAKQIAEALEAAHEQGIIHRDLKPANIKVRPDGAVKVLDFGLAKVIDAGLGTGNPGLGNRGLDHASQAPTVTTPAVTEAGIILGTAAYMSPEQARGKPVDRRTDIWAFGCVLYETLTGRKAFPGEDVTDTLAAVMRSEPAWEALPPGLSPTLTVYLKRCLHKEPRQRVGDARDVRLALEGAFDTTVGVGGFRSAEPADVQEQVNAAVTNARREWARLFWRRVLVVGAAAAIAGSAVSGAALWYARRPAPGALVRLDLTTSGASALSLQPVVRDLAITPDGSHIIYRGSNRLFVRALAQTPPTALTGVGAPRGPFVSPDGQWVGFFDTNQLKKVALTGGPPVTVTVTDGNAPRGATWGQDETIIFATAAPATGLQRTSVSGGEVTVLTTPNRESGEGDHVWPEFLPGSQAVLFTIAPTGGDLDTAQIAVMDLRTNTQTVLVRGGSHAHYVPSGHLVYGSRGTLRAVAFDLARMAVVGTPVTVVEQVMTTPVGAVDAMVAANGTLVYAAGGGFAGVERSLVWVGRTGREEPLSAPIRPYQYPRLSPDGARAIVYSNDQELDLWVWDMARAGLTRLTFEPGQDMVAAWMPDSRRVLFSSARGRDTRNVFMQAVDGTGSAVRVLESPNHMDPTGVTSDGMRMVLNEITPSRRRDLRLFTLSPPGAVAASPQGAALLSSRLETLVETPSEERGGVVSADGRWLAYESDASGRFEVYVRPFPNVGDGLWQISNGGGMQPLWAPSGRELFFVAPDGALMMVPVNAGDSAWNAGLATKLIEGRYYFGDGGAAPSRHYDVAPDGQRFLMIKEVGGGASTPQNIAVVLNWTEELKRLVPTN